MWNFIRLENEHLNNCGQFRIVRDISIAPVEMKVKEINEGLNTLTLSNWAFESSSPRHSNDKLH